MCVPITQQRIELKLIIQDYSRSRTCKFKKLSIVRSEKKFNSQLSKFENDFLKLSPLELFPL